MNPPLMCLSWFYAIYFAFGVAEGMAAEPKPSLSHVLSWKDVLDSSGTKRETVFFDADNIGTGEEAVDKLNAMSLPSGSVVEIRLPTKNSLHQSAEGAPFYSTSDFLWRWMNSGVHVRYSRGGHPLHSHYLTWTGYLDSSGHFKSVEDTNEIEYIFDGKKIGKNPDAITHLKDVQWKRGMLFQIFIPYSLAPTAPPAYIGVGMTNELITLMNKLASEHAIKCVVIYPSHISEFK